MASYIVTDRIRVNIVHSFAVPPRVKCEQYDGDYTKLIQAIVYNGDVLYNIPSAVRRIVVSGLKPDGNGFSYDCTWSGNTVSFSLMRQMTAVNGDVPCNITMFDSENNQVSSAVFVLDVEKAALPSDVVVSSNDFQTFVDYVQAANLYWQYSKSYAVGNTGIRSGENTDNSQYYAHLARMYNGAPRKAATASAMTDVTKIYVYVGSESGYNNGHWYFYNDSEWEDGGVYNAQGQQTDTEFIIPGIAADAEAVGNILGHETLATQAQTLIGGINEIANQLVTPQMFGAKGDGVTDDTAAFTALIAYLDSLITSRNMHDYRPGGYKGGVTLHIPSGTYILSEPFVIPSFIKVVGDGNDSTFLKFSSSEYGISLDGKPYNGLKTYSGSISDICIVMDGTGIGLSNAELSTSITNQNTISDAEFSNIRITNAKAGVLIQGAWNSLFDHIVCEGCSFGFIMDRNAFDGGNNNNRLINYMGTSCKNCGLWCGASGLYTENLNVEAIGNVWQGEYSDENITVNGKTYSTENPCAVYITGTVRADFISPWFERITTVNENINTYAFLFANLDSDANNYPLTRVTIDSPHFNNDVYRPIKCDGSAYLYVSKVFRNLGDYPLAELTNVSPYGMYIFRDMTQYQADTVTASPVATYNQIIFENIRAEMGVTGVINTYLNSNSKATVIDRSYYKYASNSAYNCEQYKAFNTGIKAISHVTNSVVNMKEYYGDSKAIGLPLNVGNVQVSNGTTTVDIIHQTDKTNYCVMFIAEDATAAQTLKEGYYISTKAWNKFTVTFNRAFSADATLHYFVMTS